eukprot:5483039-Pleurochrysis_carterae.AAC.2
MGGCHHPDETSQTAGMISISMSPPIKPTSATVCGIARSPAPSAEAAQLKAVTRSGVPVTASLRGSRRLVVLLMGTRVSDETISGRYIRKCLLSWSRTPYSVAKLRLEAERLETTPARRPTVRCIGRVTEAGTRAGLFEAVGLAGTAPSDSCAGAEAGFAPSSGSPSADMRAVVVVHNKRGGLRVTVDWGSSARRGSAAAT